jgi:maleate isomerase
LRRATWRAPQSVETDATALVAPRDRERVLQRLGVLTPSSNTIVEPTTTRLVAPLTATLSVHFGRFRVTAISDEPASHRQFAARPMLEAVNLLQDARVDGYLWAGTSGSWEGLHADEQLVVAIAQQTGMPTTTATLSLLDAFKILGVRRYGLVVPYVEPIVQAIERNLGEAGYDCVAREYDGLTMNWDFASVTPAAIRERARAVARAKPEAIVIHCTNYRGAEVAGELEQELGIPILDSCVVGLWGALRLLGIDTPVRGFGKLA